MRRIERETMLFGDKLTCVANEEPDAEDAGSRKVRLHARRTLGLLSRPSAPTYLRSARTGGRSKTEWAERLARDWNTRPPDEGLRSRPMPKASEAEEPAVWRAKTLTGEHGRLVIKFSVGKFPISRQGARIPRESRKDLAAKKER